MDSADRPRVSLQVLSREELGDIGITVAEDRPPTHSCFECRHRATFLVTFDSRGNKGPRDFCGARGGAELVPSFNPDGRCELWDPNSKAIAKTQWYSLSLSMVILAVQGLAIVVMYLLFFLL